MSKFKIVNSDPSNLKIGNTQVQKVYNGSTLVWEIPTTTTTTTTIATINFIISSGCTSNGNITISNYSGASIYQRSTTPATSYSNAATGLFISATDPYTYTKVLNGTWYIALRDASNNNRLTIKSIIISCQTITTTTTTTNGSPYYYYYADRLDCYDCYILDTGNLVYSANTKDIGGYYQGWDGFTYYITNTASAGSGALIYDTKYPSCALTPC